MIYLKVIKFLISLDENREINEVDILDKEWDIVNYYLVGWIRFFIFLNKEEYLNYDLNFFKNLIF